MGQKSGGETIALEIFRIIGRSSSSPTRCARESFIGKGHLMYGKGWLAGWPTQQQWQW